ncbi:GerAB/ArcD/ProY family transporter [Ectobacillus panaciterrae]|uniref:GerAB/ArcD/ProY family transporter n=1 Tax=Ectobacillus panaciterrae TaxID=363872 RepID=UPI0003F510F6|nr:endospore germination permease [Ectobacillus panaciterrae]
MLDNEKISARQFRILVILFTIGTSILNIPTVLAAEAKQDAWIAAIIGVGVGLLVIWLYVKLGLLLPGKTFVEMNETLFGKWTGKMISLGFVYLAWIAASALLFYSGSFVTIQLLPDTPVEAIHIVMAIIMVIGVRLGIETFSRTAEIFLFFVFLLFIILVLAVFPEIKVENLQPVFGTNPKALLKAALNVSETSSFTCVVLLMIFPAFVNQSKTAGKSFLVGYFIGGVVMIVITFLSVAVLGADTTARQHYPSYALARKINIGHFIQRVEAMLAIMWFISIYFKMVLYFYATALGIAQILHIKDYRPLTFPLGMISVVFSLGIYPNVSYQHTWDRETSILSWLIIGVFLPFILLCVGMFQKKREKKVGSS